VEGAMPANPANRCFIRTNLDSGTRYRTKMSPQDRSVPLVESQRYIINPTGPRRALDDGVEDWLHVRGRATDDPEHLGCCRLMLQGLPQFCITRFEFLEQSDIFDSNHGLRGKSFQQCHLLISKGLHLSAADGDQTDWCPLPKQRRYEVGSDTTRFADQ